MKRAMTALALAWLAIAGAGVAVAADYESAMAAYRGGDHATALTAFRTLADDGDARAQLALAIMHIRGEGVDKDLGRAAEWFGKAADQGSSMAQFHLGRMYLAGAGVDRDHVQAAELFQKAADSGLADAEYALAVIYSGGEAGVAKDLARAAGHSRAAAEAGLPQAMMLLARMYENGDGVEQDLAEAYFWTSIAAQNGMQGAQAAAEALADRIPTERMMAVERRAMGFVPKPLQPK